ncbi:pyridoxal 5'-phosphate synthase [Microbacterium sp. NPDC089695]|uniref:pyridoxine/pyridoxamine 5'-phosphate oxidase n=1 Tax=Microbacterium sp. NPDC089695 TaxID=3364198 RepID=UPI0038218B98
MTDPFDATTSWLRSQPSLTGTAPSLDPATLDDDPVLLFRTWIAEAVDAGVAEPHTMTLATLDADGIPDASTLILKGVDDRGWAFAGPRSSRKGAQLTAHPVAALNFWWQPVVRAVRVRGRVEEASAEDTAADLAARSPAARAGVAPGDWKLWRVRPVRVEFWQGEEDRRHSRIVFVRSGGTWARSISGRAADAM